MASETSLPLFVYRANPGTGPETANILLARIFRENYAILGPECLSQVATLGIVVSLLLVLASMFGTWVSRYLFFLIRFFLARSIGISATEPTTVSILPRAVVILSLAPGIAVLVGLIIPNGNALPRAHAIETVFRYREIALLGLMASGTITAIGIAIAVKLRYSRKDWLTVLEKQPIAACLLLLPAFIPILSVVSVLGKLNNGHISGVPGYFFMFISHVALHYSVFQFICISLIAAIPERHVSWQRSMQIRFAFSLAIDGFKRHAAIIVSLLGLGTVQVITDGSISRWFSYLVKAPEEAFHGAVFGRLSSAAEAIVIAWSVAIVAFAICTVLATSYVRELKNCPRYA